MPDEKPKNCRTSSPITKRTLTPEENLGLRGLVRGGQGREPDALVAAVLAWAGAVACAGVMYIIVRLLLA